MKAIAFIAIAGSIFISSCKKDYNCTCSTSTQVLNSTVTTTTVHVIPQATQQQAATICEGFEVYTQGNSQTNHCSL